MQLLDWLRADKSRTASEASMAFNVQQKTVKNWIELEKKLRVAQREGSKMRLKKESRYCWTSEESSDSKSSSSSRSQMIFDLEKLLNFAMVL